VAFHEQDATLVKVLEGMMNGYLVMVRCTLDDVPISLHDSYPAAAAAALRAGQNPEETLQALEFDWPGGSSFLSVEVVEFAGGHPIRAEEIESADMAGDPDSDEGDDWQ
jgi:hypothetical protein